jgi:shikimate kinase
VSPSRRGIPVFVGPRASGKTTLARLVARELGGRALDSDAALADEVSEPAGDHLARVGEARFRELEERVCLGLFETVVPGDAVSLGGGAVLSLAVRRALRTDPRLVVVRLTASPETLWRRIRTSPIERPPLTEHRDGLDEVRAVLAAREPLYAEVADHEIVAEREDEAAITGYVREVLDLVGS